MKRLRVLFFSCIVLIHHVSGQDVVFLEGSTKKIEQLVGDFDRSTDIRDSTRNRTYQRYGVPNTDLGVPFEHNGKTYVAFGDVLFGDGDPMAYTTDADPSDGIDLDFVSNAPGTYIKVDIPGVDLGGFGVPLEGVSWNNAMYLYASERGMAKSVLAKSIDDGRSFTKLYDVSDYKFINLSLEKWISTNDFPEPVGTDIQVMFGSGAYRRSNVFLAYQTAESIESGELKYYSGFRDGQPIWANEESKAIPIFEQPCVGELSVTYNAFLEKWVATYNCPSFTGENGESFERGVNCRTSDNPWGPWSDPFIIYTPAGNEGVLGYCQMMHRDWNQSTCDTIQDPGRDYEFGGTYGPYQFGNLAAGIPGQETTIYYTLSLWNPYTVVLMQSTLRKIGSSPPMMDTPTLEDVVPAVQAPLSNGLYTIQDLTSAFLDNSIALGFNNSNVTVAGETGYDSQKWRITEYPGNYYSIINESSGHALAVANNDMGNQSNIVTETFLATDNQLWQIHPSGNAYRIISKSSSKSLFVENEFKFQDTGGDTRTDPKPNLKGNVVQSTYQNEDRYNWTFTTTSTTELTSIAIGGANFLYDLDVGEVQTAEIGATTPAEATDVLPFWSSSNTDVVTIDSLTGRMKGVAPGAATITLRSGNVQANRNVTVSSLPSVSSPLEDGFYTITTELGTGQRIDDGFSIYEGANSNVILQDSTNGFDQVWELIRRENGYYTIFKSTTRDTVLAISNGAIKPLGNLQLAPYDSIGDDAHQQWQLTPADNSYRIISKLSGLSLEAQQSPPGPVPNVRQAYWGGFKRQKWALDPAEGPNNVITSAGTLVANTLRIYPNPANSNFAVELNLEEFSQIAKIEVIDLNGRIHISRELPTSTSINEYKHVESVHHLPNGLYRIVLRADDEKLLAVDKLLINR